MKPFVINGEVWRVIRVPPGHPSLIDRTNKERLATANSIDKIISISENVTPPLLDKVLLHEITHAITMSYGLLPRLQAIIHLGDVWAIDELIAQTVENHGAEAIALASESLGRPLCTTHRCMTT